MRVFRSRCKIVYIIFRFPLPGRPSQKLFGITDASSVSAGRSCRKRRLYLLYGFLFAVCFDVLTRKKRQRMQRSCRRCGRPLFAKRTASCVFRWKRQDSVACILSDFTRTRREAQSAEIHSMTPALSFSCSKKRASLSPAKKLRAIFLPRRKSGTGIHASTRLKNRRITCSCKSASSV